MNLLAKGSAWLARTRKKFASRYVTYVRGQSSLSVRATPGQTTMEVQDANGFFVAIEVRDELISVCDLVIDGNKTEPMTGDQIVEPNGVRWQVSPPVPGQNAFRFTDAYRNDYRIHLTKVDDPGEGGG